MLRTNSSTYVKNANQLYLLIAAVVIFLLPQQVNADQILEIHDGSLTTYLPSSASNIQGIQPLVDQRAMGVGGDLNNCGGGCGTSLTIICDPTLDAGSGSSLGGQRWLSGIDLYTGRLGVNNIDLAFPAEIPMRIGRSYNARQHDGTSYIASAGFQGKNWFQSAMPELVFYDSGTDSEDTIYIIAGAGRFAEFRRGDDTGSGDSTTTFKAVNGARGMILLHTFDGIDLATLYSQSGMRYDFFWFGDADTDDDIEGALWRIMDTSVSVDPYDTGDRLVSTDGNIAYVGDIGDPGTALSSGYDATNGGFTTAYDSVGRRFTSTYTSGMLTQVLVEINSGSWTEVGKVDYSYYLDANTYGEDDDLKLVTVTIPLTDSGINKITKTYYRYYEGTYDASTNPGYHHQLQYIISAEGTRNFDWGEAGAESPEVLDDGFLTASEADLKPYASTYFEYDTSHRIIAFWANGGCGCSGAASGEHTIEYEDNGSYTDNAGYDTAWKSRTIVKKPNTTYLTASPVVQSWVTQYFDEAGQALHRVLSDADPDSASNFWATKVTRNSDGQVTDISSPANVTGYTHSTAAFTTSTSAGLVTVYTRVSSTDMIGFLEFTKHKAGTSGSAYLDGERTYTSRSLTVGDMSLTRPFIASSRVYEDAITSGTSGSHLTSMSYTFHSATATAIQYIALKQVTTTNPTVTTANNGSNSATTTVRYIRPSGSTAFVKAPDGTFSYTLSSGGQITKRIADVKTNRTFVSGDDPNTDWGITETADGLNVITTFTYDDQGRRDLVAQSDGRVIKTYYSKIADGRMATLRYADYEDLETDKYHGPVSYSITNLAGKAEVQATVELSGNESTESLTNHVDETDDDPITAVETTSNKLGDLARMSVSVYDETGTLLEESRPFFLIPASGDGTEGTNFDATYFGYDDQGRRYRTKSPTGTINRVEFDTLGRQTITRIGDNDRSSDGGESSGTDNMVKTAENVYDLGSAGGNSYLTKRTAFVEDSDTDKRETRITHDVRGSVLLTVNPTTPHIFNKYDNMRRLIASGQFSSKDSIDVETDDPTTETTNRVGLSQTFYDERGQVWKSQRHKIDDSDGSDDDNLQTLTWRDASGRTIKVDGGQLSKTFYDRLGRTTHSFTLAVDNDSAYTDADDVTGDIVLVESQTHYESADSSEVLMRLSISRDHDDYGGSETTGALDSNADNDDMLVTAANLSGRADISAMWYDRFGRVTDTVRYGNNGASNFDRVPLSVPARSDTALLTEPVYNDDGTLLSTTDPRNLKTQFEYDDLGRQTAVIRNYVNGTPSGPTGADDIFTRYVYTDGLRTKMWVDIDGDNVVDAGDQDTIYTYGTTKGVAAGDSKIQTGHLLQKVQYPDSSGGTDVVTFAYNAQNQQIWTKDQEGNIIETNYDVSGRQTHKRITTLDADFDGAVRRISTTYNSRGQRQLVTQYDNATVGSGSVVDEVKFQYEDWGNISNYEQDVNSAVGAGGSVDDYEVRYVYAPPATSGRNTIRRASMTHYYASTLKKTITYSYSSGGSLHDADASRVTSVNTVVGVNVTQVAKYDYLGVSQVVGTDYPEPDVFNNRYLSSNYDALDNFGRVEDDIWYKDLATDRAFFDMDITYDRGSNITLIEDNVHVGFDVDFTIDNLNRLTNAQEGTWNVSTSSIDSETREETWTLFQTGNRNVNQLDLNGDTGLGGSGERDELNPDDHFSDANELIARDVDNDGTDDYTLTYDAVGNLTDDGENYEYEYDAFYRLRKVKKTTDQSLVAEYKYNGMNHRIGEHTDIDADGTVEDTSDDPWLYFAFNERWQQVATYRDTDTSPKEQFVYHNAGNDGRGSSSYINAVILRDKDASTAWEDEADAIDERIYYCQNWRGDVVAIIDDSANQIEQVRYLSYGVPIGLPAGDTDSDGDVNVGDTVDSDQIQTWIDAPLYDVRGDMDLDGDVDATDKTTALNNAGADLGIGNLSGDPSTDTGNRKGYAGYELATSLDGDAGIYDVRNRFLIASLGRWTRRDDLGYVDGANLYSYVQSRPLVAIDPYGQDDVEFILQLGYSIEEVCGGGVCYHTVVGINKGPTVYNVVAKITAFDFCICCGGELSTAGYEFYEYWGTLDAFSQEEDFPGLFAEAHEFSRIGYCNIATLGVLQATAEIRIIPIPYDKDDWPFENPEGTYTVPGCCGTNKNAWRNDWSKNEPPGWFGSITVGELKFKSTWNGNCCGCDDDVCLGDTTTTCTPP